MTDLATRYIGTCVVCERKIKVRDDLLVHHGYRRPGHGSIIGDCFGVGYKPHEISDKLAKTYLEWIKTIIPQQEIALASNENKLVNLEKELEILYTGLNKFSTGAVEHQNEIYKIKNAISLLRYEIKMHKLDVKRITYHIESWSSKPLLTFEEEFKTQQLKKTETAQARADKKRAKLDVAVKRFQERIDSAYKRNNKNALANLYESILRKLFEIDNTLSKQERLRLVDRESVWKNFGVVDNSTYIEDYNLARKTIMNED